VRGHNAGLRCGVLRCGKLLHFGLGKKLAVYRDIRTTRGAFKDGLAPIVL
jgi:hypothetical protein